jgi:hypothetical protein
VKARRPVLRFCALLALALSLGALALSSCGDTLQDQPIANGELEGYMSLPYPVYWLGGSFHGLRITEASQDPGGAATLQYGDCVEGGRNTCVTPVSVVTSPNNSFIPGERSTHGTRLLRGARAVIAEGGRAIVFATGPVVVAIYSTTASLAAAASEVVVPINAPGSPGGPLPARLPDTGFARRPLPWQEPVAPASPRTPGA